MTETVTVFEVGPRDGLQNEAVPIPTAAKIELVDALSACGFTHIEVSSFVSPKWVPQLADAADVFAGITRSDGVVYAALTPNQRGYDAARASGVSDVAVFAAASEAFSRKNINCSIAESLERFKPIMAAAETDGVRVRGYVSVVTDCPYSGAVSPDAVADVAERLHAMGCEQISLGETLGRARPESVDAMLQAVLERVPAEVLAGHFHDTDGHAIANIEVALTHGLRTFDAAVGGLGGCPYAPGASGNVASERVVEHLHSLGYRTGIDLAALQAIGVQAKTLRSV